MNLIQQIRCDPLIADLLVFVFPAACGISPLTSAPPCDMTPTQIRPDGERDQQWSCGEIAQRPFIRSVARVAVQKYRANAFSERQEVCLFLGLSLILNSNHMIGPPIESQIVRLQTNVQFERISRQFCASCHGRLVVPARDGCLSEIPLRCIRSQFSEPPHQYRLNI
jgi:hypothetical protein